MKILFTLVVGAALGWVNAQWDVQGQLALEQYQQQLEMKKDTVFKAAVGEVEEKLQFPTELLRWR
ncbi:hypothetical protein [Rufibacter ruber]|uniref:hypothetical protein n=1 Tax=Rufibacter ruber TaxID=1783499 RepID=UPI0008326188|nr:hypothetical protein [Rufibacter ruber]